MSNFASTRLIPFVDIVLCLCILGACGWTLVTTFKSGGNRFENENFDLLTTPTALIGNDDDPEFRQSDEILSERTAGDNSAPTAEGTRSRVRVDASPPRAPLRPMTRRYVRLVQISVGISFLATLFQLVTSLVLLNTAPKERRKRLRLWQLSHFLVVVLLSMSILVVVSYNREKDTFRGTNSFLKYIQKEVDQLYTHISTRHSAHDKHPILTSIMSGFNFYFVLLGANTILVTLILLSSCCLSFGCSCCCCC